jgi:hypothetical protein
VTVRAQDASMTVSASGSADVQASGSLRVVSGAITCGGAGNGSGSGSGSVEER